MTMTITNYYTDENGNRWDCSLFTQEEAENLSEGLINCKFCTNCASCSECCYCDGCNDCSSCEYCVDCDGCFNCTACENCMDENHKCFTKN